MRSCASSPASCSEPRSLSTLASRHGLTALTIGFAFLVLCMPLACFDVWWHLEIGAWIAQHRAIPRADWFTYGSYGLPYLDQHWGFQILCWAGYALGGVSLLVLVTAANGAASVAAALASAPRGTPPALAALAWLLPIHLLCARNFVRPEQITLLAVALTLWIVHGARERPRRLLWIPLIQVIAINCHAVAIVNVGVVGAFVLQRAWLRWRTSAPLAGASTALEWGVLGATALAGLVSPFGVEGWLFPFGLLSKISTERDYWSQLSQELVSPLVFLDRDRIGFFAAAFFAQLALGALSFALVWRDRRFAIDRLLWFAAFAYLALAAQRNINLFAIVVGAVTLANLADWAAVRPRVAALLRSASFEWGTAAILALLAVAVVTGAWQRVTGGRGFGLGEQSDLYVHGPAEFAGRDGMPRRAFVSGLAQAGVYAFHNAPDRLPFVDTRFEHPRRSTLDGFRRAKALLADDAAMARGDRGVVEVIAPDARSPDDWPAIVLDAQFSGPQILGLLRNAEWRVVFADRTGAVFVSRSLADKLGLPRAALDPLFAPAGGAP